MGVRQLPAQRRLYRRRQHDHPILRAFTLTHDDGPAVEIDVLDAQTQALQQAQTGAVKQAGEQLWLTRQHAQHPRHLVLRQHNRQTSLALGMADFSQPGHHLAQHLLIKKQQRRQRLRMGGRRHLPFNCQPSQERRDLLPTQFSRMA